MSKNISNSIIQTIELSKNYGTSKNPIHALGPVSINIAQGSFTVILGRSGSGKSTLLNLLAGLDKPSKGNLIVDNNNLSKLKPAQLAQYRSSVGIIFQFYNLLPNLNAIENVLMGSWAGGRKASREKAAALLEKFGLSHRAEANVKTLSGGERQRVAICRSLINDPKILFCDEPTGALDSANEEQVKKILLELNQAGLTIVMVTHNPDFAQMADQVIEMKDGLAFLKDNQIQSKLKQNIIIT